MSLSWDSGQGFMWEADQWEGYLGVKIHKNGGAHWRSEHGDEGIQYNLQVLSGMTERTRGLTLR